MEIITAERFDLMGMTQYIRVEMTIEESLVPKKSKKIVIVCFDRSGSMTSHMEVARSALNDLIDKIYDKVDTHLIEYSGNDYYTKQPDLAHHDLRKLSKEKIVEIIKKIKAMGDTSFCNLFTKLEEILSKIDEKRSVDIILFTDGEDTVLNRNNNVKSLVVNEQPAYKRFVGQMKKFESSSIHCLGFTDEHDPVFLSGVVLDGVREGSFQYVPTGAHLEEKLQNLIPMILDRSHMIEFVIGDLIKQAEIEPISTNKFCCEISIPQNIDLNRSIIIRLAGKQVEFTTIEKEFLPMRDTEKTLEIINKTLSAMVKHITDGVATDDIKSTIDKIDQKLEELKDMFKTIKIRPQRKRLFELYLQAKDNITEFTKFYRGYCEGKIDNASVARMLDTVYRGKIKKAFQKSIDQRFEKNQHLFPKLYDDIEQMAIQIDEDKLMEKYSEQIKTIDSCFLSNMNPIELMGAGDCLCITLKISRSQASIVDPSRVRIIDIQPSMMSADSFNESFLYALQHTSNPGSVHGGFNESNGVTIKGVGKEEINAVIPLYLFEEHWKFAKCYMKLLCGLITTLDPFGYTYEQIITIPFLVLAKAIRNYDREKTEKNKQTLELIKDTCVAIYQDAKNHDSDMSKLLKTQFENYIIDGEQTQDKINSLELFFARVSVAQTVGDLSKLSSDSAIKWAQITAEEISRRYIKYDINTIDCIELCEILGEDYELWVEQHVQKYRQKCESEDVREFNPMFVDVMNKAGIDIESNLRKGEKTQIKIIEGYNNPYDIDLQPKKNPDIWDYTLEKYNIRCKYIVQMINWIAENPVSSDLETLGLNCNLNKIWFCLQNMLDHKNSDRRERINKKRHVTPFDTDQVKRMITNMFADSIHDEIKSRNAQFDSLKTRSENGISAKKFATETDIVKVAGYMYGNCYIGRNIGLYAECIQNEDSPLPIQKIQMLITGRYSIDDKHSIKLIKDLNHNTRWKPSKKNCFRFWNKYKNLLSEQEWKQLLPKFTKEWYTEHGAPKTVKQDIVIEEIKN